ncbi:MAG: hypothetical protein EA392_04990 [Cryomorphaceae bacterium]|nr:MAG: hypothetical protein EA392_04990 [Cryomorphaceae bacterium]
MTVYVTYNDQPSGVYASQVCDVVAFLNREGVSKTKLVAFVSVRRYSDSRKKIKALSPSAWVFPMVPRMQNWRWNAPSLWLILLLLRPKNVMARGVFSFHLAASARKLLPHFKLVLDARGAYFAEFEEYRVVDDDAFIGRVRELEKQALQQSDAQLAVSRSLVAYWKKYFGFEGKNTQVIPCTLSSKHDSALMPSEQREKLRKEAGLTAENICLVYSGSAAGWQSLNVLMESMAGWLHDEPLLHIWLLTPMDTLEGTPLAKFKDRVQLRWVKPNEVDKILALADYGLLLREPSVTNQVASPTKFAEYLSAGLGVLISPQIGDFSAFVEEKGCGFVLDGIGLPIASLQTASEAERTKNHALANDYFTKSAFKESYSGLLQ